MTLASFSAQSAVGATVRAAQVTSSPADGAPDKLRLRAGSGTEGHLRFRVPSGALGATQATLLVHVRSARRATLDIYASAAGGSARRIATSTDVMGGRWVEVDVTKALRGRNVRLTLRARGRRGIDISDRRGSAKGPRLALRGGSPGKARHAERISRAQRMGLSGGGAFQYLPADELERQLDGAAAAGVQWLRFDLSWDDVQRAGPDAWNWERYDRVIGAARSRGMRILPTLGHTPPWARPPGTGNNYAPSEPEAFARFAGEAVRRYAQLGVAHWMVWNEPNIGPHWAPRPQPRRYVGLLVAAARQIRAADPRATVILGGLAPSANSGNGRSPATFLRRVYAAGGRKAFDAVATHPYSFPVRPSNPAPWNAWQQVANTNPSVRGVMIENGDADKLVWMTEFGAPTGGPAGERVSRVTQARILVEGYALNRKAPWAGPLFWHTFADSASNGSREPYFGLVTADMRPKPSFNAYRRSAAAAR